MTQYFEFKDEKSNKFWEISQNSSKMIVRYGKIGVLGQTLTKEFSSPKEATIQVEKSIAKKLKEGYLEVETQKIESSWPFGNTTEDDKSTVTKIIEKKLTKDEVVKGNKILLMFPMRELYVMEIAGYVNSIFIAHANFPPSHKGIRCWLYIKSSIWRRLDKTELIKLITAL